MGNFELLAPLAAAVIWLILTLISKALGKKFIPESAPVRDLLIDLATLTMATQVAVAFGDTPLVSSIVDWILAQLRDVEGKNTVASVTVGGIIGIVCGWMAWKKGRKFSKFDEESFAWKELSMFTIFFLVLIEVFPWVNDAKDKIAEYFTTPVGAFALKVINNGFSIHFSTHS